MSFTQEQPSTSSSSSSSDDAPDENIHLSSISVDKRTSRRRLISFGIVSLACLGILLLLGLQLLTPATPNGQGSISPLIGHPAPDFTLPQLSQHPAPPLHLSQLKGHVVVLNFWASWCDACKEEAPTLQANWQRYKSQGVIFLGVDMQDTQDAGLGFMKRYGITYPNVSDTTDGTVSISYGVRGIPETYIVNKDGVIVEKLIGALNDATIQKNLRSLLS